MQVLHEQIEVPGTNLKLCYLSSRTQGYRSLLKVTMTPAVVPMGLLKVHLMVAVEGHLFQKWFHASPNLAYTYIWDKKDAYGQRVYGLAEAVGEWEGRHRPFSLSALAEYIKRFNTKGATSSDRSREAN